MFKYKSFEWCREDKYNFDLYQWQDKEIQIKPERGWGRGKGTGEFEKKLVFIGHYNTISGCLYRMLELDLENSEFKDFNNILQEHKKYNEDLFKELQKHVPIEETKILEQVSE